MAEGELRFLLVVDASTGLVKSVQEIDEAGGKKADLEGKWVSATPAGGFATTLVFISRKDETGAFPKGPIIRG